MQNRKHLAVPFGVAIGLLTFPGLAAAQRTYVDADAAGANNGTSWADAYN